MIDVLVHGYFGKMGQVLKRMIMARDDMNLVAGVDALATPEKAAGEPCPVYANIAEVKEHVDVVIDFSYHTAVKGVLDFAKATGAAAVVATTGLEEDELAYLNETSKVAPIFRSANMSLGINVMAKALQLMAPFFERDFNFEMIEKHHNMKKDSPSGTALLLADKVNESLEEKKEYVYGRSGNDLENPMNEMGIHAVRGGTIAGEHTMIFAGPDEIIEVKHFAISREIFATGALTAAAFMAGKGAGLYSMDDVIG